MMMWCVFVCLCVCTALNPLEVSCMANTPIIINRCLMVWPYTNKPVTSIECKLSGHRTLNCKAIHSVHQWHSYHKVSVSLSLSGTDTAVLFTEIPPGIHRLIITARTEFEQVSSTYRLIFPAEPCVCTSHLINRGITVTNQTAVAEFSGVGAYSRLMCKLDNPTSFPC